MHDIIKHTHLFCTRHLYIWSMTCALYNRWPLVHGTYIYDTAYITPSLTHTTPSNTRIPPYIRHLYIYDMYIYDLWHVRHFVQAMTPSVYTTPIYVTLHTKHLLSHTRHLQTHTSFAQLSKRDIVLGSGCLYDSMTPCILYLHVWYLTYDTVSHTYTRHLSTHMIWRQVYYTFIYNTWYMLPLYIMYNTFIYDTFI